MAYRSKLSVFGLCSYILRFCMDIRTLSGVKAITTGPSGYSTIENQIFSKTQKKLSCPWKWNWYGLIQKKWERPYSLNRLIIIKRV
jgi:hypothetical protein